MNPGYYWCRSDDFSRVPNQTIKGGYDTAGNEIFVARIQHEKNQIAASFIPNEKLLSAIHKQQPVKAQSFEVHFLNRVVSSSYLI
jgi:hypothetical protein